MNYTEPQKQAITTLNHNLVVTAGAGSGKTRVLVDRFVEILKLRQAALGEILAITFTNKAAREMKARVRSAIDHQLAEAFTPQDEQYWRLIKSEVEMAQISTIHSLGLNILRQHPVQAQIDPNITLLDAVRAPIELEKVVRQIVVQTTQINAIFRQFVTQYQGLHYVIRLMMRFYNQLRVVGGYQSVMLNPAQTYAQQIKAELKSEYEALKLCLITIHEESLKLKSRSKYVEKWQNAPIEQWLSDLKAVTSLKSYEAMHLIDTIQTYCKRPVKALAEPVALLYQHKTKQGLLMKYMSQLGFLDSLPLLTAVGGVLEAINEAYIQLKTKHHWLDFADLELSLLQLFERAPDVLSKYQQQFRFIMVDEFQDTNPLQQRLIRLLAPYDRKGLFIVGDAKQSIYRFRAAEVQGFVQMAAEITLHHGEAIYLDTNFRSNKPLVDFFNDFFAKLFTNDKITYQAVKGHKDQTNLEPEVQLWLPHPDEVPDQTNAQERRLLEAELIAYKIATMCAHGCNYGDFALLFRAMTGVKAFERALKKQGIPYVVIGSRGFFECQEVIDCINLLTFLHHPQDKLLLTAILRSPFFGLSDEGLYWLQQAGNMTDLHPCLQLSATDQVVWQQACQVLKNWKAWRQIYLPAETLDQALHEVNFTAVLLGSSAYGLQAQANIEKLLDFIYEIQQTGLQSWTEILTYLERMRSDEVLFSEAPISAENDNVVRLMSIHQSKGLEFPVVIVPEMQKRLEHPIQDPLLYAPQWGVQLRSKDYYGQTWDHPLTQAILEEEHQLEMAESKRLLYVAATRAQQMLIFSAFPRKLQPIQTIPQGKSWLDWILYEVQFEELPPAPCTLSNGIQVLPLRERERLKMTIDSLEVAHQTGKEFSLPLKGALRGETRSKLTFSCTALLDFVQCSRQFYYKHILKMPQQTYRLIEKEKTVGVNPLQLGTMIHEICEKVTNKQEIFPTWANILDAMPFSAQEKEAYTNEASPMLNLYAQSSLLQVMQTALEIQSERPFRLWLGDFELTGIIDKVIVSRENELVLLDYKSNKIKVNEIPHVVQHYQVQMAVYALAIYQEKGIYPHHIWLYFLRNGQAYDLTARLPDAQACQQMINLVLEPLRQAIGNQVFTRCPKKCHTCIYQWFCK